MSSHTHSHDHGHHGHDHVHGHVHHGHAHAPTAPHPPMALPPSFMRLSLGVRLGVVIVASAALWSAVWLAMR
jgi:hypothetical protein